MAWTEEQMRCAGFVPFIDDWMQICPPTALELKASRNADIGIRPISEIPYSF